MGLEGELRVIGAGFGRTGTTSLKAALERLGFGPCYHMTEVLRHPSHASFWNEAHDRAGDVDWRGFFRDSGDYRSAVDWPVCDFYRVLMDEYPRAKVILTVRDPDRWYRSARETIYALGNAWAGRFVFATVGRLVPSFGRMMRMAHRLIWAGTFGGRFTDEEYAKRVFLEHDREVRRTVPPERLLVYDVKEGWGPLCKFLGVEVPDEPFPHLNDAATFRRLLWLQRAYAVLLPAGLLALLLLLALRRARDGG